MPPFHLKVSTARTKSRESISPIKLKACQPIMFTLRRFPI